MKWGDSPENVGDWAWVQKKDGKRGAGGCGEEIGGSEREQLREEEDHTIPSLRRRERRLGLCRLDNMRGI